VSGDPATGATDRERVVLLDESGRAVGTADKRAVHHADTPLHLAFSCYLFDGRGSVLVTQRALDKATFPGTWTNSVCGHPAPGERLADAVVRRARQELGVDVRDLRLVLPVFRYEATAADGVRENEMCPVFTGVATGDLEVDPVEVEEAAWEPWEQFRDAVLAGSREVSVWCRAQVVELAALGVDAHGVPAAEDPAAWDRLPPAVRGQT
jgi:isopentenyl-diphosphate delta-isomerase